MPAREHNFIIIGQGLAGSILAYTLINQGQSVLVIDNDHCGSASSVAAGIINPVTGHRLNISDRFDEYYPAAKHCYQALEGRVGQPLWHAVKQTRLIRNQGEQQYLNQRQTESVYDNLLGRNPDRAFIDDEFGAIEVLQTATVDAPAVLSVLRTWLTERQAYQCANVDYQTIVQTDKGFQIGELQAKQLVFCEGYQAIHNPWLKHLPFKLAKGEILTVQTEPAFDNALLSWGNWLVSSNGQTKLGSNFIWDDLSLTPNKASKEKLLTSLSEHTHIQATVIAHKVGIRPATTQRKPFIGEVSNLKHAYCFNGFGSKGCLLIPHYANLLAEHLLNRQPLPEELTQWI